MANKAISKVRPGFVRVLNPVTGKTFPLLLKHANNPNYMSERGLVIKAEPKQPPIDLHKEMANMPEPEPITVHIRGGALSTEPSAPKVTKASPVKTSRNGQ